MAPKPKLEKPVIFTEQFWRRPAPQPMGDDDPKLVYQAVGEALSQWEQVDQRLADLFLAFTCEASADDMTKRAIRRAYGSIISTAGRREAIRAAAEIYFVPVVAAGIEVRDPALPERKDVEAGLVDICKAAGWAAKLRDDIAHGAVREDMEVVTRRNDEIIKEEKFGSFVSIRSRPRGRLATPVVRDQLAQAFQSTVGKGDGLLVAGVVDPEASVLWLHLVGQVPQQLLVLAEDFGGSADRERVGWRRHGSGGAVDRDGAAPIPRQ
jgi:hypothetical protein